MMLVRFGLKIGNEVHVRLAAHQPHDKIGYSSISFGGRFGRSARMDVDDVDVSDERGWDRADDVPASIFDSVCSFDARCNRFATDFRIAEVPRPQWDIHSA